APRYGQPARPWGSAGRLPPVPPPVVRVRGRHAPAPRGPRDPVPTAGGVLARQTRRGPERRAGRGASLANAAPAHAATALRASPEAGGAVSFPCIAAYRIRRLDIRARIGKWWSRQDAASAAAAHLDECLVGGLAAGDRERRGGIGGHTGLV